MYRKIAAAIAACALTVTFAACGGDDAGSEAASGGGSGSEEGAGLKAETMKLGFPAGLTGFVAFFDNQILNGMKIAVDEINARGGIDGKVKLDLQARDAKGETPQALTLGQQLVDSGAKVLFSMCNSDTQLAMASLAQRTSTVALSGCNGDPGIGSKFPNYWGVGLSSNVTMAAGAQYASQQGYKTYYMLGSEDLAYNRNQQRFFDEAATELGLKKVGSDTFHNGATDFAPQIARIRSADPQPDAIFSSSFVPDTGTFLKQLRAAGSKVPYIGGDGADSALLTKIGRSGAEGSVFPTHAFPQPGSPVEDFYAKYDERFGERPDSAFAGVGYNEIKLVEAAVLKARSTDAKAMAQAINDGITISPPLSLWEIEFPKGQHWPVYQVPVVEVADGAFRRAAYFEPKFIPQP
ncbi:MAG: branched-chain amino acid transport system substrate-binding protein [Solirubrobacteraceae bacterium]|nr:branched-chain amino acid transport system substrate-binding protein [Solirubrobacteraceae bacterium]